MKAQVMKSTGSWYLVHFESGEKMECRIRGKFRLDDKKITNPIAVGDWVDVEKDEQHKGKGIITAIEPRENYLIRKSTRKAKHGHILAANLDQVVLMATLTFPRTSIGFIDRFLVAAESFRIPQVVLFNKKDLYSEKQLNQIEELKHLYEDIGVGFLSVSVFEDKDLSEVKDVLQNKVSLLAGHSGVGKSTLLNKLAPHINQKIGEVSTFANKGTHTTTFAEMFALDRDTYVIDTPGIKELGLIDIYDEEISHFFPEMRDLLGSCKFHNCTHTHEPGCVVIEAVKEGEIAMSRYESYLSILDDEDTYR